MKHLLLSCIVGLPWILGSCAHTQQEPAATRTCSRSTLKIGGNQIWVNEEGAGDVTVAFEAGSGNDSCTLDTSAPYSIDNDVHILRTALTSCGIVGPVVMVGHSYGGGISLVAASQDERIRGIVLLDALVPRTFGNGELEKKSDHHARAIR